MEIGMLWLDDDGKRPLSDKVLRAAEYYQVKYGRRPDMCMVNPLDFNGEIEVVGVRVKPAQNVLRHHLWIGLA